MTRGNKYIAVGVAIDTDYTEDIFLMKHKSGKTPDEAFDNFVREYGKDPRVIFTEKQYDQGLRRVNRIHEKREPRKGATWELNITTNRFGMR